MTSLTFTNHSFAHLTWDGHHVPHPQDFCFSFLNLFSFISSLGPRTLFTIPVISPAAWRSAFQVPLLPWNVIHLGQKANRFSGALQNLYTQLRPQFPLLAIYCTFSTSTSTIFLDREEVQEKLRRFIFSFFAPAGWIPLLPVALFLLIFLRVGGGAQGRDRENLSRLNAQSPTQGSISRPERKSKVGHNPWSHPGALPPPCF